MIDLNDLTRKAVRASLEAGELIRSYQDQDVEV